MADGSRERIRNTPFKSDLLVMPSDGITNTITELEADPEKIVRFPNFAGSRSEKDYFVSYLKATRRSMAELAGYGISIPRLQFVVAPHPRLSGICEYVLTDRIHGQKFDPESLDIGNLNKRKLSEDVATFYRGLVNYLFNKFDRNEPFLADLFSTDQYMYGNRKGEVEPRVYLIDVDGVLADDEQPEIFGQSILSVSWLLGMFEDRLNTRFDPVKNHIKRRLNRSPRQNMIDPLILREIQSELR